MIAIMVITGMAAQARAESVDQTKMAKVKSAYLLNFIKFTQWPETQHKDKKSPFVITVLGEDQLGEVLDKTMAKKIVRDRAILVRRVEVPSDSHKRLQLLEQCKEDMKQSHVVFVSASLRDHLQEVLSIFHGSDILTVSDMPSFAKRGGMLELTLDKNRIVFHANKKAVTGTKIKISSKLLRLAKRVESR